MDLSNILSILKDFLASIFIYKAGKTAAKNDVLEDENTILKKHREIEAQKVTKDELYDVSKW